MEIEDIDNKLDMHFEIHFNDWSKITEISRELSYNGEIAIISEEKSIYFYVFFPKNDADKYRYLFPLFDVEERKNYFMALGRINNRNIKDTIDSISNIDGLIINSYWLKSGSIVMEGYFHHNKLQEFSNIILSQIVQAKNINKILLRPVKSIYANIRNSCQNFKNIVISIKYDEFNNARVAQLLKNTDTIAQLIDNYPVNNKFRIILYSNDDLTKYDGINIISREDGIYTTKIEDDFLGVLGRKTFESRISWQYSFIYEKMGRIYASFLIPDYRAREYIDMIIASQMEIKRMDLVTIENYSNINEN
ncbi:hypothetical protein [Acidiplasma sp.]|uniref:hypothetical protein n=1 Tax=Acidiplasma sp. TaxID=1872114 RepID=UPI0025909C75|nr:hypothetical protein [Acidiplasma sp.]